MLKAENIASQRQYYFTISLLWLLIFILLFRYFQLQILNFDQYSKKANTNRVRKVIAKEEEVEKLPCLADLKSLIDNNVDSPNKEIFMEFHGISTKKRKMAELSRKYDMSIKDITSVLNRTKTALSRVAKERVSA